VTEIIGQTSAMAAGTLVSRITGVFRDIALVAAIGTGIFSDTYSIANSIPNIIYILIAGGAINSVFIPSLVRHMEDDADQGCSDDGGRGHGPPAPSGLPDRPHAWG
jgi:putative peptidoglycan lipid II flippase